MLKTFPPDSDYWTKPLISFEGGYAHHALMEAENMAVEIAAHYRRDGQCVVVSLRPKDA